MRRLVTASVNASVSICVLALLVLNGSLQAQWKKDTRETRGQIMMLEEGSRYLPAITAKVKATPRPYYTGSRLPLTEAYQLTQDFELATFPPTGWSIVELAGTGALTLRSTLASGYGIGAASARFEFYNVNVINAEALTSPALTATVSGDSLKFDHAGAPYSPAEHDSVYVEASTDGGTSWITLAAYDIQDPIGPGIATAAATTSSFVPTAGQWGTKTLGMPVGSNMIRFKAVTQFGNNVYIDNISVGQPNTNDIQAFSFDDPASGASVLPNLAFTPTASFKNVGSQTQTNVSVKYEINNGPNVYTSTKSIASIGAGATSQVTFDLVAGGLASGGYTLRLIVLTPDQDISNDTLNGTLTALPPLSGTKTIGGTTPDYASFTAAIDALAGGVGAGGVTFQVRPGNYGVDAGTEADTSLQIDAVNGAGVSSPIVFVKESGTVTLNCYYLGVVLNGADYVTFDGIDISQNPGGAGRTLNVGYYLNAASATDGASNNTLKNFVVLLNDTTSAAQSGGVVSASTAASSSAGANSYNKILNFNISGGSWGITFVGNSTNRDIDNEVGTVSAGSCYINAVAATTAGFNTGIYLYGQDGLVIHDVEITGSQAGAASLYGITANGTSVSNGTVTIRDCRVHGMISRQTGTGNARMIHVVIPGTYNIYNNEVYDVTHFTTGTAYVAGIAVEGGTGNLVNIYNNFISDIKNPSGTGTTSPNIRAINTNGGTTINVYHNTVYLDAPNTSASRSSAAMYVTSTPTTVDLRNNVFVNMSAIGSGASTRQAALFKSTTSLTNLATTSNNNLLYAGTPTFGKRLIYYDATNSDSLLSQFQARVSPRESFSVTENPPFINVAVPPYDLHITAAAPTQIESQGQPLASVTTDIDGDARNASTPDIGADEGAFGIVDLGAPAIGYTALGNVPLFYATRTLNASIVDFSGVPTTGIGLPVLYWKISAAGSYAAATGVYVSGTTYQFTFGTGAVLNDTVFYYVAAQDNYITPNVAVYPSAGASGLTPNPPAAAVPPTNASSYRIIADVHDYAVMTIDPGPALAAGTAGSVGVLVKNLGNVPETNGTVKLFENGIQVGTDGAISLVPGESGYASFPFTPSVQGTASFLGHTALAGDGTLTNDSLAAADSVYANGYTGARVVINSTDISRPFTNLAGRFDTLTVTVGALLTVNRVRMTLDSLTHTFVSDIDMFLFAPNGDSLEITTDNGSSGDHFFGTAFTDFARSNITTIVLADAPFRGYYKPEGATGFARFRGSNANGDWILRSLDDAGGDDGNLRRWTIEVDMVVPPNTAPSAVDLLEPADATRILVSAQAVTATTFRWSEATDPDLQSLTYTWEMDTSMSFGATTWTQLSNNSGADTLLTFANASLNAFVANLGVGVQDSIIVYWRVSTSDGIASTLSAQVFSINVVRQLVTSAPDAWGYTYTRSTDPGGPTFNWIDITGVGTLTSGLTDDNNIGPYPVGFTFPYYWYDFSNFRIGSNGYITPGNQTSNFSSPFAQLPAAAAPNDIIAAMAGDLVFTGQAGATGQCYYWSNGVDTLIISYLNVTEWESTINPASTHTFQIILSKVDNSITFQYGPQGGSFNSTNNTTLSIGMENQTGSIGLNYGFSSLPPHPFMPTNGLAVKIWRTVDTGLEITDGGIVGGFNADNVAMVVQQGVAADSIKVVAKNYGTVALSNVRLTHAITKSGQPTFRDTVFVVSLQPSEEVNITFPKIFTAAVTGSYTATFTSTVAGDQGPSNNSKVAEILSVNIVPLADVEMAFEGGVSGGSINWTGGGGMGVMFDSPTYPIRVRQARVNITGTPTAQPMIVEVISDSLGFPGHALASRSVTAVAGWNLIDFTSDSNQLNLEGTFFVGARGQMAFTYEVAPPISYRTWEYTGGWATYRSRDVQDVMIRAIVRQTVVGIGDDDELIPIAFALRQNYPNPFNPTTKIEYDVKENSRVVLKVYNVLGQEVRTLVDRMELPGIKKSVVWDGKNNAGHAVSTGVYIYRIEMGSFVKSRKMMLMK